MIVGVEVDTGMVVNSSKIMSLEMMVWPIDGL